MGRWEFGTNNLSSLSLSSRVRTRIYDEGCSKRTRQSPPITDAGRIISIGWGRDMVVVSRGFHKLLRLVIIVELIILLQEHFPFYFACDGQTNNSSRKRTTPCPREDRETLGSESSL